MNYLPHLPLADRRRRQQLRRRRTARTVLMLLASMAWSGMSGAQEKKSDEPRAAESAATPGLEQPPAVDAPRTARGDAEIRHWIEELDAPQFAKRQAASQQLYEAGLPAIAALQKAALEGSREVTMRAIDILKRHHRGTGAAQEPAAAALQSLSQAPQAIVARAAQEALKPPVAALPRNEVQRRFAQPVPVAPNGLPGGIQIGNGGIQVQIQGRAQAMGRIGGVQRMQMQNINGNKKITVEQAGRKVLIEEQAAGPIKMEVTETKDGKEVTRKAEAKDADDLKKNHAELHKIYEEFSQPARILPMPGVRPANP